jgi:hypothetical protein
VSAPLHIADRATDPHRPGPTDTSKHRLETIDNLTNRQLASSNLVGARLTGRIPRPRLFFPCIALWGGLEREQNLAFDADGYAAVFTEDGVLDWARGEVKGRPAIREFMASGTYDLRKLNFAPAQTPDGKEWPSTVRHLVTNQVIEIDGDSARAISYWMNYGNNADRRKIEWLSFGSWDDTFVKIDGQWFFKRHTIYNEGNPNRFTAGQPNPLTQ